MFSLTTQTEPTKETEYTKVLTFAGLPAHESVELDLLLAVIDSWDKQCNIYANIKVDGNPIIKEALLQKIPHSASTLTLEWLAKKHNLYGWNDSQTMTIATVVINNIKYPPTIKNIIPDQTIHAYSNFDFTLNASSSSNSDKHSLTLNAYLDNGLLKASSQSFDPSTLIKRNFRY
ncbi:MAG: hypothetical protein VKN72_12165 [Nostocales cyanobacterium 94392]|nr:hypothetical protein [Nostocales cyanobacterium 94392]